MVQFKPEVRIGYFDRRIAEVIRLASLWSYRSRVDVKVTSLADGAPGRLLESLHPFDLAIDLDAATHASADLASLADYLRRQLAPQYDVVFETDHVHVEWDAHRGALRSTPPAAGGPTPTA